MILLPRKSFIILNILSQADRLLTASFHQHEQPKLTEKFWSMNRPIVTYAYETWTLKEAEKQNCLYSREK